MSIPTLFFVQIVEKQMKKLEKKSNINNNRLLI